jgi:WD40 repeat protein
MTCDVNLNFRVDIKILNLKTGKFETSLNILNEYTSREKIKRCFVTCLLLLKNGNLASGFQTSFIRIWNVTSGFLTRSLLGHTDSVKSLLELNNNHLASGSRDFTIKIWNSQNGTLLKTLVSLKDFVFTLVLLKNENIVSGSVDGNIKTWNITLLLKDEKDELQVSL